MTWVRCPSWIFELVSSSWQSWSCGFYWLTCAFWWEQLRATLLTLAFFEKPQGEVLLVAGLLWKQCWPLMSLWLFSWVKCGYGTSEVAVSIGSSTLTCLHAHNQVTVAHSWPTDTQLGPQPRTPSEWCWGGCTENLLLSASDTRHCIGLALSLGATQHPPFLCTECDWGHPL